MSKQLLPIEKIELEKDFEPKTHVGVFAVAVLNKINELVDAFNFLAEQGEEKPVETGWAKEFDNRFTCAYSPTDWTTESHAISEVKSFISSLLSTTIQEERARVKGIIEKVMRESKIYTDIKILSDLLDRLLDEKN